MRRATVTTTHGDADAAERVARALAPDNTAEMTTGVDGGRVVTTVTRERTSGLQSTVDDYVVNCRVADRLGDEQPDGDGTASTAYADNATDDTPNTDT